MVPTRGGDAHHFGKAAKFSRPLPKLLINILLRVLINPILKRQKLKVYVFVRNLDTRARACVRRHSPPLLLGRSFQVGGPRS